MSQGGFESSTLKPRPSGEVARLCRDGEGYLFEKSTQKLLSQGEFESSTLKPLTPGEVARLCRDGEGYLFEKKYAKKF